MNTTATAATPTEVNPDNPFTVHLTGQPFLLDWCEDTYTLTVAPRRDADNEVHAVRIAIDPTDGGYTDSRLGRYALYGDIGSIVREPNGTWTAITYRTLPGFSGGRKLRTIHRHSRVYRSRPAVLRALIDLLHGWEA